MSKNKNRKADLENYVFGKVPPQAKDLEEAVLGALMLDKDGLFPIIDFLKVEHFYTEAHQDIYKAILSLYHSGKPFDMLMVAEKLKKDGTLENIKDGSYYLVELTNRVASAANIEYHSRIIQQKFVKRRLVQIGANIISSGYDVTTDCFDDLSTAQSSLVGIIDEDGKTAQNLGSFVRQAVDHIETIRASGKSLSGVPSGFFDIDERTGGWQQGDLIVPSARPSCGKCLGYGTKIIMFDGSIKEVQDIVVGDLLMGVDSTFRKVKSLSRGREMMYNIKQQYAKDYVVNESHILSLKSTTNNLKSKGWGKGTIHNLKLTKFLSMSKKMQVTNLKGYKLGWNYDEKFLEKELFIDPYFLGVWLGDGFKSNIRICTPDVEIINFLKTYSKSLGMFLTKTEERDSKSDIYSIVSSVGSGTSRINKLKNIFSGYDLLDNKHIPDDFLYHSKNNRLLLLAGLLDTDGYLQKNQDGTKIPSFEFSQKCKHLTSQIKFLADSLGFRTRQKSKFINNVEYQLLYISGNVSIIPTKIKRKQSPKWTANKDFTASRLYIEKLGIDNYYGFELEGKDRLFLLEDGTVTHNTTFTLNNNWNATKLGFNGLFISGEMRGMDIAKAIIAMEQDIINTGLYKGNLKDEDYPDLLKFVENYYETNFLIDDTTSPDWGHIKKEAMKAKDKYDIKWLTVDFLQTCKMYRGKVMDKKVEVEMLTSRLKNLAKELNIPIFAIAQVGRGAEKGFGNASKRPRLSDLKEAGAIEELADVVPMLYRPTYYNLLEDKKGRSLIGILEVMFNKHRKGATGTDIIYYDMPKSKCWDFDRLSWSPRKFMYLEKDYIIGKKETETETEKNTDTPF